MSALTSGPPLSYPLGTYRPNPNPANLNPYTPYATGYGAPVGNRLPNVPGQSPSGGFAAPVTGNAFQTSTLPAPQSIVTQPMPMPPYSSMQTPLPITSQSWPMSQSTSLQQSQLLQQNTAPLPHWGPKPMSGQPGETIETFPSSHQPVFQPESHITTAKPQKSRPMTPSYPGYQEEALGLHTPPVNVDDFRRADAELTPAEQTVKRLEQPLIRFLDENPDIRRKIDNVNLETLAENVTETMGNYRVSIHNAYKHFPRFIDNMIIKQLDPQMQDSARQLFDWVRKSPTAAELDASTRAGSGKRSHPLADEETEPAPKKRGIWPFRRNAEPVARHQSTGGSPDMDSAEWDALLRDLKAHKLQTSRDSFP